MGIDEHSRDSKTGDKTTVVIRGRHKGGNKHSKRDTEVAAMTA